MIIRKYRDLPAFYAPDIGEVVDARRSPGDVWTRAYVVRVQRKRGGNVKFTLCWLADDPQTVGGKKPIVAHTMGYVNAPIDGWPLLIRQISRDDFRSSGRSG